MNEQIRQLAIQADIGFDEKYHWYVSNKTLEKFAELIVRESADVVGYYYTRNVCVSPRQIKRHFGVEE